MKTRTKWGFAGACSIVVGIFWGCGGSLGSDTGGESHFLIYCDDSCGAGLSCISGVCTRGCVVDQDSCTDLHPEAECTDESIEPGEVAVCDVGCSDDAQCEDLGANFACESGQCRGDTAGTSGSGGSASTGGTGGSASSSNASNSTSSGGGAGPTCEHLFEEYPDGASFDNHAGCGTCTCEGGEAECTNGTCVGTPVFPCPAEVRTDPINVDNTFVQGDVLLMYVSHSGGCETHAYGLCFEPEIGPSETTGRLTGELRLIHDSNGDTCEAFPATTLQFNLRPYAEYVMDEQDAAGGVVSTAFGLYAFGELSCDDRTFAAGWQATEAAEQTLDFPCTTEADCIMAPTDLSCFSGCGALISAPGEQVFTTTMEQIQATLCDPYDAAECPPMPTPLCELLALDCVENRCVVL